MAIEQLFEALPLHYLQHGITKFGAFNVVLGLFITVALGILADYAYMLYLRSKMVRMHETINAITRVNVDSHRDHFLSPL